MNIDRIPSYPPAVIVKWMERFRYFLVRFSRVFAPSNVNIIEMVQGFYVSKAIGVAAGLNIAEYLRNGEKSITELAMLSETDEESLYRLMRMLASQGVFVEKKNRIFCNNKLSKTLLDQPDSMRHMVIHQVNGINWKLFGDLNEIVSTGESTFKKHAGMDVFEYMQSDPKLNELYNKAMTNTAMLVGAAMLSEYNFEKAKCIVDIGGGEGILLAMILKKYKSLKGINFDLPHVVSESKKTFENFNVADRVELISGDFYNEIPTGGDLYFLKSIFHNINDLQCIDLLKKIKSVLPKNGRILIFEPIIEPNNGKYSFAKLYDTQMLVSSVNAKERTKEAFFEIFEKAGFNHNRVIRTVSPFSIIEVCL
jgi:ubiquinone/menaquinone biosynthesis C-methylase UbiE